MQAAAIEQCCHATSLRVSNGFTKDLFLVQVSTDLAGHTPGERLGHSQLIGAIVHMLRLVVDGDVPNYTVLSIMQWNSDETAVTERLLAREMLRHVAGN